jgi:GT2 family glycosyltransferase
VSTQETPATKLTTSEPGAAQRTVSVIVVGYGEEPHLGACLEAVVRDLRPDDEVVLVDNGITGAGPWHDRVAVVAAPSNGGFSAGCALGVEASSGDILVFVNSDAFISAGAIDALRRGTAEPGVGLVTGCVVLAEQPTTVNSVGNPVHFSGISWAGSLGEPARDHESPRDVASVSGALFAMRRQVWNATGGLDPIFFMYHEDTDLSLRCHLAGLRVTYCPAARASHVYDFNRNPAKLALLERHRLAMVLTVYEPLTLLLIAPALLALEVAVCAMAVRGHWMEGKWAAWMWLIDNRQALMQRRRDIQSRRVGSDELILDALTGDLSPGPQSGVTVGRNVRALSKAYWWLVRRTWRLLSRTP